MIEVEVSDGDRIVLHEDAPGVDPSQCPDGDRLPRTQGSQTQGSQTQGSRTQGSNVLLIHGLTGCHAAPYMLSLADGFLAAGHKVYRMDMRGFGDAWALSGNLSHAGRSDDVIAALNFIAAQSDLLSDIFAIGISLGGAQLLRGIGRIDGGLDQRPEWWSRLRGAVAVCPPVDLVRCSRNMQHWSRRLYNRYFIRSLIQRTPQQVRQRSDFQERLAGRMPRTLWELDDRITAPLSGFSGAEEYYDRSSCRALLSKIRIPTLVIAARDDPIVPIDCFDGACDAYRELDRDWEAGCQLFDQSSGGHVGFVGRRGTRWLESVTETFLHHHSL